MSDERLDRIESKLDAVKEAAEVVKERIANIDTTLAVQSEVLKEHTRRSLANEKAVDLLSLAVVPVRQHIDRIDGALKLIGVLALVATVVTGIMDVLSYWKH